MNKEAINKAIAQACGYDTTPLIGAVGLMDRFPDFYSDLNAMHEAEKVLSPGKQIELYNEHLSELRFMDGNSAVTMQIWHTTAAQRAEAFLRTIGKWEE
jgi:hypothetical protein